MNVNAHGSLSPLIDNALSSALDRLYCRGRIKQSGIDQEKGAGSLLHTEVLRSTCQHDLSWLEVAVFPVCAHMTGKALNTSLLLLIKKACETWAIEPFILKDK